MNYIHGYQGSKLPSNTRKIHLLKIKRLKYLHCAVYEIPALTWFKQAFRLSDLLHPRNVDVTGIQSLELELHLPYHY